MGGKVSTHELDNKVGQWLSDNEERVVAVSNKIFNLAELQFEEYESAKTLINEFEKEGFKVVKGVANIETAFTAEWSNGDGPVIALLGEYDALKGLGHELATVKKPTGKAGHGCGHNLLGTGSMAAAFAMKHTMEELGIGGTIKYFGTPAEEGGYSKVFMVRDGVFDGIDALVRWHPLDVSHVSMKPTLAITSVKYTFNGKTSHAASEPHIGRSAADAAILMDVGLNYLRERIESDIRINSVITNAGEMPNVVPDLATVELLIRAPNNAQIQDVYERINKIAKGMAMATETSVEIQINSGASSTLANKALSDRGLEVLKRIGGPKFSDKEIEFAKEMNQNSDVDVSDKARALSIYNIIDLKEAEKDLYDDIVDETFEGEIHHVSTDSGDVSWQAPMCQFYIATMPLGTTLHSWQSTVSAGMGIGHKGMMCAAEAIALTSLEVLTDPDLLDNAKEEFNRQIELYPYENPLPKDLIPGQK